MDNSGSVFDKQMAAKTERNEPSKSPTRLQKQAPAALQLDRASQNLFSPSSAMEGTAAIPLLSPLFVSPSPQSSPREGEEFRFLVGVPEKKGSQVLPDHQGGWQHPAMAEHAEQMALLTMFQTKFVLINDSH